jgi:hypothetical protein
MLLFMLIFAVSVAALLAVREMDVECLNPARRRVARRQVKTSFPPYAATRPVR